MIDARLGFKKVTADLLRKIEVRFGNEMVRSYDFIYIEGAFRKTLLDQIVQFDNQGQEFNRHRFDYYDEARNDAGVYNGFGAAETWDTGDDGVGVSLVLNDGDASAVGGTRNDSSGKHLYVGFNPSSPTKPGSIGGKVGSSKTKRKGILAESNLDF